MPQKQYELSYADEDDIPLSSFIDEFKIVDFDVRKLTITVEVDRSGCWYPGEQPTLYVTIRYDDPSIFQETDDED